MESAYKKIDGYMESQGAVAVGLPYTAFLTHDMNDLEVEIGIPIGMYVVDKDDIVMSGIPGGQ